MADKYGNETDFKKMMEKFNRDCSGNNSNSQVSNQDSAMTVTRKLARNYPTPDSKIAKEFDKSRWEYWEKHVRKKLTDSDGRKVMVYEGDIDRHKTNISKEETYDSK